MPMKHDNAALRGALHCGVLAFVKVKECKLGHSRLLNLLAQDSKCLLMKSLSVVFGKSVADQITQCVMAGEFAWLVRLTRTASGFGVPCEEGHLT